MDDKPFRKINYFTGFFLRAEDLQAAEAYRDQMRWMHNLLSHGPGVLRGFRGELKVTVNDRGDELIVEPGLAIDRMGRELYLPNRFTRVVSRAEYDLPKTIYVVLSYDTEKVDFRENLGNRDYSGNAFIEERAKADVTATPPGEHALELARIRLTANSSKIRPAAKPYAPAEDEIDMRLRLETGIARSVFQLQDYAKIVRAGEVSVGRDDTARIGIEEVTQGERARVFSASVYPQGHARVRWHQEASVDERGATEYTLLIENVGKSEATVTYKVYRLD